MNAPADDVEESAAARRERLIHELEEERARRGLPRRLVTVTEEQAAAALAAVAEYERQFPKLRKATARDLRARAKTTGIQPLSAGEFQAIAHSLLHRGFLPHPLRFRAWYFLRLTGGFLATTEPPGGSVAAAPATAADGEAN